MKSVDKYIQEVLNHIHASPAERERFEADLRAHFQEAMEAGESFEQVAARLGPPLEVAEGFMAEVSLVYAGFWRRLAAFAIDMLLIFLVLGTVLSISAILANLVPREPRGFEILVGAVLIALIIGFVLVGFGTVFLYFPILEGRFGQTLGKRLLGLRVLKESGMKIGYREAFLRRISYYFEVIVVDALFIPFTEKRQRAFDIVARTVVVVERT